MASRRQRRAGAAERFKRSTRPTRSSRIPSGGGRYTTLSGRPGSATLGGRARLSARVSRLRRSLRRLLLGHGRWERAAPRLTGLPARICATTSASLSTRRCEASRRTSNSISWIGARPVGAAARHRAARPLLLHLRRPRRGPERSPDDARADGQRHGLHPLQRRRPGHRLSLPDMPRRGSRIAPQEDPGHHPGRHRRGPPDPAVRRGRGRSARRPAGQPLRRRPRHAPRRSAA